MRTAKNLRYLKSISQFQAKDHPLKLKNKLSQVLQNFKFLPSCANLVQLDCAIAVS